MLAPLSWLKDYTPLATNPRDAASVEELRRTFDSLGLVVESVERVGEGLSQVVLSRVLEVSPIKGADRIRRILVDAGASEPLEIVCGAWNFDVGDVVPLAPVGAVLPGGFEIAQRKLRGVTSNGMLCSGRELGLSEDAAGLMVLASTGAADAALPSGLELGASLIDYLGITPDVVFDLAVEPNRPDCLSMVGVARDVAARLSLPFEVPRPVVTESGPAVRELASLRVAETSACRRFVARVLEGLSAVPSDETTRRRLVLAGMRPINAIVDASNYVMLELGQPSHPYDLDELAGHGITVRFARPGETLVTLDGETRTLGEQIDAFGNVAVTEDLVICDADDVVVGLAGVMGGASSEISEHTSRVFLEVADFDPLTVGRAAARLSLRSEASVRFWRGIDPAGLARAADRFCELVTRFHVAADVAPPTVAAGFLDSNPEPFSPRRVTVRTARVNALLGTSLSSEQIVSYLEPIGFRADAQAGVLDVEIPSFRPDSSREVDVIEEVARHFGYDAIARTTRRSPYVGRLSAPQQRRRALRSLLRGLGAHEAWTSSIVDPELTGDDGVHVELTHPIVPKERALRRQLVGGLLGALSYNTSHRNGSLRLFEVGHVFHHVDADSHPSESEQLGALFARDDDGAADAMRALRALREGLRLPERALRLAALAFAPTPLSLGFHPTRAAAILALDDEPLGVVGEIDPQFAARFSLTARIGYLALDLDRFLVLEQAVPNPDVVSHFPSSDVDLSFVLDETVAADALYEVLRDAAGPWCEYVRLVDVYRDEHLATGTRSLSYRLRFCAPDHTLTDPEVKALRANCIDAASHLGATLRA